ncbi:GGDEF domain-containing protein [Candidatus Gracilibacteria bacterium 28_42_T64]|nr:GGDEF domain-containing protein [Candidatus Gracilibacteria bacterium 28_42_T64]
MTGKNTSMQYRPLIKLSLEGTPREEKKEQLKMLVKFSKMKVEELLELSDSNGISAAVLRDLGVSPDEFAPDDLGSIEIEEYMKVVGESLNSRIKNIQLSSVQHIVGEGAIECISKDESSDVFAERIEKFDKKKSDAILEGVQFLGDGETYKSGEECIQVKFELPGGREEYIVMTFESQTNDEILYKHDLIVLKNLLEGKNISKLIEEKSNKMKQKYSDGMTGLYNSTYFNEILNRQKHDYSGIFIDVSSFKKINDENGQLFGDKALIKVARFLESCVRANDRVIRLGGDEFFILFNNGGTTQDNRDEHIKNFVERIEKSSEEELSLRNDLTGKDIKLGLVFGYATSSKENAKNGESLLTIANDMLKENKDPEGEAYRVLSLFKSLSPKAVKPAIIELISNQVFSDKFFPALLQSEEKGDYFFDTFMNVLYYKVSELSKGGLDDDDIYTIEENIRYLQLMRGKETEKLREFFIDEAA